MPFRNKYRPSRVEQIEKSAWKNGFKSYFRDPGLQSSSHDPLQDYFHKGFWKNNKKSGFGYKIFGRQKLCYEGYFENDLYHGYGRLVKFLPDESSQVIYEGHWAQGRMEGPGRWYIPQNRKDKPCKLSREIPVNVRGQNEPFPSGEGGGQVPSECYLELLEDEEDASSCVFELPRRQLSSKLDSPGTPGSTSNDVRDLMNDIWGTLGPKDESPLSVIDDCCCESADQFQRSFTALDWLGILGERPQKKFDGDLEKSSEAESDSPNVTISHEDNKNPCVTDLTKPTLKIKNNTISFQQLKQVYKEFQYRTREEKKNDTWDEFVNQAQFQVRPDPEQDRIDYVHPNFTDPRKSCPKGIFNQNENGNKISIREGEPMQEILKSPNLLHHTRRLGLKVIDETKLKFYLYDGIMRDDLPHGVGFASYSDDVHYYGDWRNGQFHGRGILMSPNEYSWEGEFQHGVRLGQGVYINYQTGFVQRGFWAKGGFVESTVELHPTRRQSAIYPAIYPIPILLETCDNTVDEATSTGCKGVGDVFQRTPPIMIRCGRLLKCVK